MLVLPNITCSNITCQTALFPLAASQQHSKPCGRPAPTMSTKLRYSANSRRNSASCSAVGAGTPEDPDKIPNVALGSESETAPGQHVTHVDSLHSFNLRLQNSARKALRQMSYRIANVIDEENTKLQYYTYL
jgi:hypothetical protein